MKLRSMLRATLLIAWFGSAPAAFAQLPVDHPGRGVYERACATCHDNPGTTRAAALPAMQQLAPERLREVLTTGVMQPMAAGLSAQDMTQLITWMTAGQQQTPAAWTDAIMCAADRRAVNLGSVTTAGFGGDRNASRSFTAKQAGLKKSRMKDLEPAWVVGFPGQGGGTGATVVGDTAFIAGGQRVIALDAASGCAKWVYAASSRNTPTFGELNGRKVLAFSVSRDIHVIDAQTGELVWKADGQASNNTGNIRGGVAIHNNRVIVPISASGVATGVNPTHECCIGHGAVVVLDGANGSKIWEWHATGPAEYNGFVSAQGVKQRGPSGAPIWSVPTIDVKRNRVIVTTGENTSHPATDTSDAVIALDLDTGKMVWNFQGMPEDVWNMACNTAREDVGPNCPWHFDEGQGRDFDFGAQAIIAKGKGGKDIVLAGQKSGHVWALDAETGKLLWSHQVGEGTALGGIHWGIATDGIRVFAAINDPADIFGIGKIKPGMFAIDIKTGKRIWGYDALPNCEGARATSVSNCTVKYGFSAAPLVVDGTVIGATLGGEVFVFDAKNGKILKRFDTVGAHASINGIEAKGGSIDAHGLSVGGGAVIVNSGYGSFGQTPGNALIALKPKK